jgi:hypothetical protein
MSLTVTLASLNMHFVEWGTLPNVAVFANEAQRQERSTEGKNMQLFNCIHHQYVITQVQNEWLSLLSSRIDVKSINSFSRLVT